MISALTKRDIELVLELGPLVVFFMANKYGDALAQTFPVLGDLGGKIFHAAIIIITTSLCVVGIRQPG